MPRSAVALTRKLSHIQSFPMDMSGSSSGTLVKRKNDVNWGGAREGAGRKKKTKLTSQPLELSLQTLGAADAPLASSVPLSQLATAAVGFFAPRQPSVYRPVTNSDILGSTSVANVNRADTEGEEILNQGVLTNSCAFAIPDPHCTHRTSECCSNNYSTRV